MTLEDVEVSDPKPSDERNGCFLDSMWCCEVCDGEIPDGHTDDCYIWKLEKKHQDFIANEYNKVLTERAALQARLEAAEKFKTDLLAEEVIEIVERELAAMRREGWVLVPREPTPMLLAAMCPDEDDTGAPYVYDRYVAELMYHGLIAAALKPQGGEK